MNKATAATTLAQLSLPAGCTGSTPQRVPEDDDTYVVHVDGADGWILEFSTQAGAADAQISLEAIGKEE